MPENVASTRGDLAELAPRPPSLARMFLDRVAATPNKDAFWYPERDTWQTLTWAGTADRVRRIAAGLLDLGIQPEQRIAIASNTRIEWILADLAIMCAGAATTTVYPTTNAPEVTYILSDSGSRFVFAEDDAQVAKLKAHLADLPYIEQVITFDGHTDGQWVISLADLETRGEKLLAERPDAIEETVASIEPEDLATLVYTSGTTGRPKGVRLVHDNWTYEGAAIEAWGMLRPDDLQYLWLPLSHVFGKMLISGSVQIGLTSAVDGRVDKIVDNLSVIRPTFMAAAPRIFEKVHARVTAMAHAEGAVKAKIFDQAVAAGRQVSRLRRQGKEPGRRLSIEYKLADRMVFQKIRDRFGGRLRFFISGSAALNKDIAEWFHAAGVVILEGYGLTESSAATFVNGLHDYRFGTVGPAMVGTEVRIADDGEVLIKGPGVMRGYHNQPEQTKKVLDPGGWLRTGDIGELDGGFLRLTDRKIDLIKTAGGKFVAPQAIETKFKAICPYIDQFVVHGEGRPYCVALATLDPDTIMQWAEGAGLSDLSRDEVMTSPEAQAMLREYVDRLNSELNRWETIKKVEILPHDLTVEDGDLTPSLKVKRQAVELRYEELLDSLYD